MKRSTRTARHFPNRCIDGSICTRWQQVQPGWAYWHWRHPPKRKSSTRLHTLVIPENSYYDLFVKNDAMFSIYNYSACNATTCFAKSASIRESRFGHYPPAGVEGRSENVYALPRGARISSGKPFMTGGYFNKRIWPNGQTRYVGLHFQIKGRTHYGWARIRIDGSRTFTMHLTGYAYESIPNKPIAAGQTHGNDEATLGRLAQGASGVAAWRQKQ